MNNIYKIKDSWLSEAKVNKEEYEKMYEESISDNESFWSKHGKRIDWFKPYTKIKDVNSICPAMWSVDTTCPF